VAKRGLLSNSLKRGKTKGRYDEGTKSISNGPKKKNRECITSLQKRPTIRKVRAGPTGKSDYRGSGQKFSMDFEKSQGPRKLFTTGRGY